MKRILFLLLASSFCAFNIFAQEAPFYNDIKAFKQQDSLSSPPQHAILFVGSSSFTKWKDVQDYFPGYTIINRGFGGSSLPDVIRYAGDIIYPCHPKQIVIYCGENDFPADSSTTAKVVLDRFKTLYEMIRKNLGEVPVAYISIKPSPSRRQYWPKIIEANKMIRNYIRAQQYASFIDVWNPMLNSNHQPQSSIFLDDSLHMNAGGYKIWQKAIQPHLMK